ncbi:MAG: 4-hydroxy-3-methylbut-2-en-1-yl diphosphate synthase [Paludibacteraceae bacterium]|nr:4-hydroxy-3-methylbut-2-en-1-yl diphosphate synthase [Paludibacteraceae bacterium]MBP6436105.1 4-hydroxy-3-methylbut-2-en-1-yl diphosphate synthase [Paludibacteraceae bacterium]MBP8627350.1 4-hydroxy-3-methylbut-2-en-1-yl diphosphate synthase [Paludibacteraceae bacterium]MBP9647923.1 4-hydroxy-3-methylbut-2-en-1-yl diphosphate synthase [Paludibacteraceae bacterium]NLK92961.1 4-hydroxy-3-methylbut-2-en-1-yl diphosphate synthase [Bacteroidales bacterium]
MGDYCLDIYNYHRRNTDQVLIGTVWVGSKYPIRVQSMTNTSTMDTDASTAQCEELIDAGAELVRLTTQGVREAQNLYFIRKNLLAKGYVVPLVADVHFNPKVAEEAARIVEKVRINPGNFVDSIKTFQQYEYTDEEYAKEIAKIEEKLIPLLEICKENSTAIRIGVNHGSLSDRIMSRFGDTPQGMVESCMEFLRICRKHNFLRIVISVKASNTMVMVHTVRLLVATMQQEGMRFPLHLGVTEAGDAEDGRIKSAVGIGALLIDGIGDTIRVSLSEHPKNELPVANKMVDYINQVAKAPTIEPFIYHNNFFKPFAYNRRKSIPVGPIGNTHVPIVIHSLSDTENCIDVTATKPDFIYVGSSIVNTYPTPKIIDAAVWRKEENTYPMFSIETYTNIQMCDADIVFLSMKSTEITKEICEFISATTRVILIVQLLSENPVGEGRKVFATLHYYQVENPVVLQRAYNEEDIEMLQIKSSVDIGSFFLDGFGDGIMLENKQKIQDTVSLSFSILQATRARMSKTEFISCPGCGRTLFDLQQTIAHIKRATSHLNHLKIGIMGCIVNGPGEMADADYGYVGAGKGKISLYKKQECVQRNIPEKEAVQRLIQLIKDNGDWYDNGAENELMQ